ncbi:hypothetical protein V6N13_147236 [Hibiscus sabdariffa]|uniref:Uncharacterized protein n=1 Tax=Hibiscus sabdariffa TaxID=183260 RepID=A0ABR2TV31_9ROSI
MEVLRCREFDDLNAINGPKVGACFYELVADGTSDAPELLEHGHEGKSLRKGLGKCASLPSFSSLASPVEDEVGTVLRRILSAGSLQLHYSFSVSLPAPLKLVSALKGSRSKRGMTPKKLSVTWAPDVYDPLPTSSFRVIINRKQQKLKKNNEKKKNGKKGLKGHKSSRVSACGKDIRRSSGSSYKWPKYPAAEGVNPAHNINDFNVGMPDHYCVSNFLIQSYNRFHYPVTEAL